MKEENRKPVELSPEELEQVNGGVVLVYDRFYYIHNGCGGIVDGVGGVFEDCVCRKCGARSYWAKDFPGGLTKVERDQ